MSPRGVTAVINRSLNIRSHEWPRLSLLVLMLFLVVVGNIWGRSTVYAGFLQEVGVAALPLLLTASAAVSLLAVVIYSAFADRISNDHLLLAILLVMLTAMISGRFLLGQEETELAYYLLYLLYLAIMESLFFLHWWTYVNGFYDTRTAKRLIPVVATAARVASIIAGFSMSLLNRVLTPADIILLWLLLLALVALLAWGMPWLLGERRRLAPADRLRITPLATEPTPNTQPAGYLETVREGAAYVAKSPFLRWLAASTLLLVILIPFLNYYTSDIFVETLADSQAIADFVAALIGAANLLLLPVQLFWLGRFINRVGLGNATLLFPSMTAVIATLLVIIPGLPLAALGFLNRTVLRATFHAPSDSLLYNAVPLRVKGRARAFVSGLLVPIGSLIGSGLLLLPLVPRTDWFVPAMIGLLGLAFFGCALGVRRQYGRALVNMLEQEDYSFLLEQEASELTVVDPATLERLQAQLAASERDEFTLFMARLISEVGGETAVSILATTARQNNAHVRASIIDLLAASHSRSPAARQLYDDMLADPDGDVRHSALRALVRLADPFDADLLTQAQQLCHDDNVEVRTLALYPLLRAGGDFQAQALALIEQMRQSPLVAERVAALRALAQTGELTYLPDLLHHLTDEADEVRLETAVSLETLLLAPDTTITPPLAEEVMAQLEIARADPVERIRQMVLQLSGRLGRELFYLRTHYQWLIAALQDESELVRETAVDTLVSLGKAAIPEIHPLVDSEQPQVRKLAALVLARIDAREYGPLIASHVTSNLLTIYHQVNEIEALTPLAATFDGLGLLCHALREDNQQLLAEIFYLLTALQTADSLVIIQTSLHSQDRRTRINALEALEALTSPQKAQLIAPLCDQETQPGQLLALAADTWEMQPLKPYDALARLLVEKQGGVWLRAVAAYSLGEIGAALTGHTRPDPAPTPPPSPPPPAERPARQRRRRSPADILNALSDDAPAAAEEVETAVPPTPTDMATVYHPPPTIARHFHLPQLMGLLQAALQDEAEAVQTAAAQARRLLEGRLTPTGQHEEDMMLSIIDRIIFLKEVLFFQEMTIDQLRVLASVCEESLFTADTVIYKEGDPGGILYVVVRGQVAIEREGRRKGSVARLGVVEAHAYFGEMNLFDQSPRTASAVALQDTVCLTLHREPLIALARQQPNLSLSLINVLSQRLRQTTERVAELTRSQPRELHKLFDQLS
jgi:CRP-like cAMP-binding protein/ATP/ADP translocase/HEAT repeat protein